MEVAEGATGRLFTPTEADALVPSLQLSFAAIGELRRELEALLARLSGGDAARITRLLQGTEPAAPEEETAVRRIHELVNNLGESVAQLTAQGVLIQDLDPGLVDFPAFVDGRYVLLCWQFGEPAVSFFHELDRGFTEREVLPDRAPVLQ